MVTIQNKPPYTYKNRSISKFDKDQNEMCTFCNNHSETIQHLFWTCRISNRFWRELEQVINTRCSHSHNFHFTEMLVLFGQSPNIYTDKVCDLFILMAKNYIYRCKVQNIMLNRYIFIQEFYRRYCIEKFINKNSIGFQNSWCPYLKLFQSLQHHR